MYNITHLFNKFPANIKVIAIATLIPWSSSVFAESIKTEGRVDIGFETDGLRQGESIAEAKIRFENKRSNDIKAVGVLKGDNQDENVELQEAYIDKKISDSEKLIFGLDKILFGLDYHRSTQDRYTAKRSLINEKLEEFGFVGREMMFQYKVKEDTHEYHLSLGYADSNDADLIFGYSGEISEHHELYSWMLVQSDKINDGRQLVWAIAAAHHYDNTFWISESEFHFGVDPFETEFEKTWGNGVDIYYYFFRTLAGFNINIGENNRKLRPIVQLGILGHDHRTPNYNSLSGLLGISYLIDKDFVLSFNSEIVATNSKIEPEKRHYDDSRIVFEVKYFW